MTTNQGVVVTGGSSGLGLALARAFALQGKKVAIVARDQRKLDAAVVQIRMTAPSAHVHAFAADVAKSDELRACLAEIDKTLGGIDLLVNCAGILREGYFEELSDADQRAVMDVNFFGTLNVIRVALPYLKKSTNGHILNVASMAALTGVFGYTAYCASKHALLGASDALRAELAPQGIRVQVACPSEFDSPMVEALDLSRTPENRAHTLTIPKVSVQVIVDGILQGLTKQQFLIVPGTQTRLMAFGLRHFPSISRWVGDRQIQSTYIGPANIKSVQ